MCGPVHNFRACTGISVHHFKLDNQRIPLLPVLCIQLGERGKHKVKGKALNIAHRVNFTVALLLYTYSANMWVVQEQLGNGNIT